MNYLSGWRPRSFCIFNTEKRDGRGCALTRPCRERAEASALAEREKGAEDRLAGQRGKHVPSAALHQHFRCLQISREILRNKRRLQLFPPVKFVSED